MIKKRNWGCVVYPESLPDNWLEILQLKGLPFAVSPLHDKDIDDEVSKTTKKPHYHVILCFPGPTTDKVVNDIIVKELGQPIAIPLESVGGYYRYFTHKDNPDKYQYNSEEIKLYNGFDVTDVLNNFEVFKIMKEIQHFILDNCILEYSDLMDFLIQNDKMEMWNVACSHTQFFNSYITSKRHKLDKLIQN